MEKDVSNYNEVKLAEGTSLVSGRYDGTPMQEDDDCPVCRLTRRCREEGREPKQEELMQAMWESQNNPRPL
ncbi:MAG TPA: hypothetical protein VJB98_03785 [Candidatus Paceibacterota bacterium]